MLDELFSFVLGLVLVVVIVKITSLNNRPIELMDNPET
jgi:hypothetical protein